MTTKPDKTKRTDIGNVIVFWVIVAGVVIFLILRAIGTWLQTTGDAF